MTGREQGKYCSPDSGLWIGMTAEKGRKDLMDPLTEEIQVLERSDSKGESSVAHQAETTVSSGHSIVIEEATAGEERMAALLMPASREF
jgi:hypothetical protein